MSKSRKSKYTHISFKSASLSGVLDKFRKHYKAEREPESFVVPYILTCAAYLESKLNDSLLTFAITRYGEDVAAALMSLFLPGKLNVVVPILTDGRYRINHDHYVYQRLASLIRVRNSITHAKPETQEIEAQPEDLINIPVFPSGMAKLPRQFMVPDLPDLTLGASKMFSPLEYHDALDKLEKWFFLRCPDKLGKVAMVIDRKKEGQWEEVSRTMVKDLRE